MTKITSRRVLDFLQRHYIALVGGITIGLMTSQLAQLHFSFGKALTEESAATKLGMNVEQLRLIHRRSGLSNKALLNAEPEAFKEAVNELRFPDLPALREQYLFLLQRSEQGRIPTDIEVSSFKAFSAMADQLTKQAKCSVAYLPIECVGGRTAGLPPNRTGWMPIGPTGVGGRTRAVVIDKNDPQSIWIGSVGGGIWHSTNGGKKFVAVNDLLPSLAISTLVMDPNDSKTLFAGTGEGFSNLDALRGSGILVTHDAQTWTQIASTIPLDDNSPFLRVNRLAFSPDGKTLLAATWKGIYLSTDSKHETWSNQLNGNIADIEFHPKDSKKAVAGGLEDGSAYYSEDAGLTWHRAAHDGIWTHQASDGREIGRVELCYAAAQNEKSVVYASVDVNSGQIWKSEDGGKSFVDQESENSDGGLPYYLGDQGWYDNAIWAGDPSNPNFVVVGGVNLWKSEDGGKHLTVISNWQQSDSIHADHHVIVSQPGFDGKNNRVVYFGNDGGFYRTNDITQAGTDDKNVLGWEKLNTHYGVTQFYGIAWNRNSGTLLGGAQDNGTVQLQKGAREDQWTEEFGGDGGFCAADPNDKNFLFGEYVFLGIHRSSREGQQAEFINGLYYVENKKKWYWKDDQRLVLGDSATNRANFIAPFVLDPNDATGNTIFAGGASLWRTIDAKAPNSPTSGPHWSEIKVPVPGWDNGNGPPNYISAITARTGQSDVVWVGYNRGDLYVTKNARQNTPDWVAIPNMGAAKRPSRMVTRILIDPLDPQSIYVTYGGFSDQGTRNNVWKSTDGGSTWKNVSASLPAAPVFAITMHPQNHKFLYLGSTLGIFASEDAGKHWSVSNEGPVNTAVSDFTWMNSTLVAATHGRGVWTIDLSVLQPTAPNH